MNVHEKRAWFILAVSVVTIFSCLVSIHILGGNETSFSVLGLLGLAVLAALIGRRDRKQEKEVLDERDNVILQKARRAGLAVFWFLFVAGMMSPYFVLGREATVTVPTTTYVLLLITATVIVALVQTITTIVLYRRG